MNAAVSNPPVAKAHLRVLTNSELREARACLRRHKYKYRLRRRPRKVAEPLTFGTLFHAGQEALWPCDGSDEEKLAAAIGAIRAKAIAAAANGEHVNEYTLVTLEELTLAYVARWSGSDLRAVSIEQSFELPLINPETGAPSRTFRLGGKYDGIVIDSNGRLHVLEHKTTTSDLEFGSLYWAKVKSLDTQVSHYIAGAKAAGFDVEDCIYDVIRKPGIKPLKATPEEEREYTKPKDKACPECKKKKQATPAPHQIEIDRLDLEIPGDALGEPVFAQCHEGRVVTDPGGRLYKNQRERDESPEEFRLRLRADITERTERYFAREPIVRLESEEREFAFDVWQAAKMLHEAERSGYAPKNPDACSTFGQCPYLAVCSGEASIDDEHLFRTASTAHEELETA